MTTWRLTLTPETCVAIGGYTASWLSDKATARDERGFPLIPATAVKGALRIEAERLFTDTGLDLVRKLFGAKGSGRALLRFTDARFQGNAYQLFEGQEAGLVPGYQRRVGVAISRKTRTVQSERLFDWETTAQFMTKEDASFVAEVTCPDSSDDECSSLFDRLGKALAITGLCIGSGKTRGMGQFSVSIRKLDSSMPVRPVLPATANDYLVRLVPEEQFRVSRLKPRQFLMETADYIPGATLRGAIAQAIGFGSDGLFDRLFNKTSVRFGPLYPAGDSEALPRPVPFSARTCKVYPGLKLNRGQKGKLGEREHGFGDILLFRLCNPEAGDPKCPLCQRDLKPLEGYYYGSGEYLTVVQPETHLATKLAVSRTRLAAEIGEMYSCESLASQVLYSKQSKAKARGCFVGRLTGASEDDFRAIAQLGHVFIGGAAGRGFGKMELKLLEDNPSPSLDERLQDLADAVAKNGLKTNGRTWFTLDIESDLVLPYGQSLRSLLKKALGDDLEVPAAFVRQGYAGGYNAAIGMPKDLMPAVLAGSCIACSVPASTDNLNEKLEELESSGLGLRRHEGYGRIIVCDEFHYRYAINRKEQANV
jgi:CRISPR-associated protein Csx10